MAEQPGARWEVPGKRSAPNDHSTSDFMIVLSTVLQGGLHASAWLGRSEMPQSGLRDEGMMRHQRWEVLAETIKQAFPYSRKTRKGLVFIEPARA